MLSGLDVVPMVNPWRLIMQLLDSGSGKKICWRIAGGSFSRSRTWLAILMKVTRVAMV